MAQVETKLPYKVKDISLADFGRKRDHAGRERNARLDGTARKYGARQAARGARIAGCLHMTIQTAVLDRDADRTGRRGHLEQLQYLFDPGPRRRSDRRRGFRFTPGRARRTRNSIGASSRRCFFRTASR